MYDHPIIRKNNLRRMIHELDGHRLVRWISHSSKVRVRYTTGVSENWYLSDGPDDLVIPYDPFRGKELHVGHQYEYADNEALSKMHLISYKLWRRANFVSRRLVIQELLGLLLGEGYIQIEFPHEELVEDLQTLWKSDIYRAHTWRGMFLTYGHYGKGGSPGRKIIEQFTSWGEYGRRSIKQSWCPWVIFRAIRDLLRYKRDVTRHSLMCLIGNRRTPHRAKTKYVCPNVYRVLFQKFGIKDMILADPHPSFGSKAIAAAMEGNHYCTDADFAPLESFLGVQVNKLNKKHYDAVILDYDWDDPGDKLIADLKKWAPLADIKLVYVPKRLAKILPPPDMQARIETHFLKTKNPDFVYCYM